MSLQRVGRNTVFSVDNFGETIPAGAIPHLFTFGGRHSTYAAVEKGPSTGLELGLFIASEHVAGHGGCIEAKSTDDMGTTFKCCLAHSIGHSFRTNGALASVILSRSSSSKTKVAIKHT